jgi:hypothetical protein
VIRFEDRRVVELQSDLDERDTNRSSPGGAGRRALRLARYASEHTLANLVRVHRTYEVEVHGDGDSGPTDSPHAAPGLGPL